MITRRDFVKKISASPLAAFINARISSSQAEAKRPNILWLSCEDIGPHLGCYGDPHAVTPSLDNLAGSGVRYENVFTVAPVCAPNRSCIITGVYPTTLGTHNMRAGGEGVERSVKPPIPSEIKCFSEYLRQAGYYCTNNYKEDYQFDTPSSAWDESSHEAHWRNRPTNDTPFFAVFNYTGTHEGSIRLTDEQHAERTKNLKPTQRQNPDTITTLPPYYPDTPITRLHWARYYELITAMDYWVADMLQQLEDDGLANDTIVFFWSDHGAGMPRAKRFLYDSGIHVPMIVYIPEELRVDGQGEPNTVDDRLISTVDLAPTVLNLLGIDVPSHMQGQSFLGAKLPKPRDYIYAARDRMDERYDLMRAVRDKRFKYIRNYECNKPYYQYMTYAERSPIMKEIRRLHNEGKLPAAAEKFMVKNKPPEELYDLQVDPHEINNLAENPEYLEIKKYLLAKHQQWLVATKDLGFIPEPYLLDLEKQYGTRYAITLQEYCKEDSIKVRRHTAAMAGNPNGTVLRFYEQALENEDVSVRYWGMVGLGNLKQRATSALSAIREALLDTSVSVRVMAARGLCLMGHVKEGLPVLIEELKNENEWARLFAALALDEIGEQARPAIANLKEALNDTDNKYVVRVANHALNVLLGTENEVR